MSKSWITAEELMRKLNADPDWVRRKRERDAKHKAEVKKLRKELEPEESRLRRDLAKVGVRIRSVWELVNSGAPYPKAIPILLRHFESARHPVHREGLARALTVEDAQGLAGGPILRAFKQEQNDNLRFALANALSLVAGPEEADEIAALIREPATGEGEKRVLKEALARLRRRARKPQSRT